MIDSIKGRKILRKRCIAYLAHIVNRSNKAILGVKDNLVVKNFLNVFPNSLPRLTLKTEAKFSNELALGTVPNSKAP